MDPKDDPEARIRELEQASGANQATELGVGQSGPSYSYVPPAQPDSYLPPPPPSGYPPPIGYAPPSGYPPAPQSWSATLPPTQPQGPFSGAQGYMRPPWAAAKRGGARRLVLIPLAIGLFAIVPGLISFFTNTFHTSGSGFSHNQGGGGGFTFAPTTASPFPTIPTAGGQIVLGGSGDTKTIACNDGSVIVGGFSNTITITGHCASVTVSGSQNVVVLDDSDSITVAGSELTVTYHSGTPTITNPVPGNVVEQG